jgi:hypothetical protein
MGSWNFFNFINIKQRFPGHFGGKIRPVRKKSSNSFCTGSYSFLHLLNYSGCEENLLCHKRDYIGNISCLSRFREKERKNITFCPFRPFLLKKRPNFDGRIVRLFQFLFDPCLVMQPNNRTVGNNIGILFTHRYFKSEKPEAVYVNLLRSSGIDSQPGEPLQQVGLSYRPDSCARMYRPSFGLVFAKTGCIYSGIWAR